MPPISTIMHFGKIFIESQDEIDIPCFMIGIISPSTFNDDELEELHNFDEDGNLDVREFYEQFNFKIMSEQNNVIRKQPKHTFPKKKVLCLVSNAAQLHGMEVGFFAEEMTRPFFDFINISIHSWSMPECIP